MKRGEKNDSFLSIKQPLVVSPMYCFLPLNNTNLFPCSAEKVPVFTEDRNTAYAGTCQLRNANIRT